MAQQIVGLDQQRLGYECSYGAVQLQCVRTREHRWRPVFSELGRYLYSEVTLTVEAVFNPELTSYQNRAPAGPLQELGHGPAETYEAIKHYLLTPNRKLVYESAGDVVISTPLVGDGLRAKYLDAHNGPVPLLAEVSKVHGGRTWNVVFSVQTFINDSKYYRQDEAAPVILENSWSMSEHLDLHDHYRSVRTITGQALFRSDRLHELDRVPDDFRAGIFHPIPHGFRRDTVNIDVLQSGLEARYTLVDREESLAIKQRDIVKIDAGHTVGQKALDLARIGSAAWMAANNAIQGVAAVRGAGGPWWRQGLGYAGAVAGPAIPFLGLSLPGEEHLIRVAVWGNMNVTSAYCANVAFTVARAEATGSSLSRAMYTLSVTEYRDLVNPYAEVTIQAIECALNAVGRYATGDNRTGVIPDTRQRFPAETGLGPNGSVASRVTGFSGTPGIGPPNHGQSRGRYLGALLAQVLSDPTQLQTRPSNPRNANQENPR